MTGPGCYEDAARVAEHFGSEVKRKYSDSALAPLAAAIAKSLAELIRVKGQKRAELLVDGHNSDGGEFECLRCGLKHEELL